MIGKKPDRRHDHVAYALGPGRAQPIADVGPEPRLAGRAATALIGQVPMHAARCIWLQLLGNQSARFAQLGGIVAAVGHRVRNAVGREDQ